MSKVLNGIAAFLYCVTPIWSWHFCFKKQLLLDSFGLRLYTYFRLKQKEPTKIWRLQLQNQICKTSVQNHFLANLKEFDKLCNSQSSEKIFKNVHLKTPQSKLLFLAIWLVLHITTQTLVNRIHCIFEINRFIMREWKKMQMLVNNQN